MVSITNGVSMLDKLTTKNFSLNLELILAFASSANLEREVKHMPPNFKRIA